MGSPPHPDAPKGRSVWAQKMHALALERENATSSSKPAASVGSFEIP